MDEQTTELVTRLLDEIDQLSSQNSQLRSAVEHYEGLMEQAADKIEELQGELDSYWDTYVATPQTALR